MNPQATRLSVPVHGTEVYNPFVDPAGLGVRTIGSDAFSGELLEVLRLTPDLGSPAGVEPLVRARCTRFSPDALLGLSPVVRVERTFDGRLEVWSRLAEGFRLSAALEWAETRGVAPSLDAALTIGDRLLASLASLQAIDQTAGASGHGAIAIDQIVVSESGALTLTDYAFGTTLAALQWPREQLWRRFRIAMPPAAGLARFDHRVDVTQASVVIAALLAGRVLKAHEYPRDLASIVSEAVERAAADAGRDERDRLTEWLRAATELESRSAFKSAALARTALREALGHRLDDARGVGQWLRAARGVEEVETVPAPEVVSRELAVESAPVDPAPVPPPAVESASEALPKAQEGRLRKWLSRW